MTHTPAVDSHVRTLEAFRSMFAVEHTDDYAALTAAIAALTRPPGGSERLRDWKLEKTSWEGDDLRLTSPDGGSLILTNDARPMAAFLLRQLAIAALASPQGAEKFPNCDCSTVGFDRMCKIAGRVLAQDEPCVDPKQGAEQRQEGGELAFWRDAYERISYQLFRKMGKDSIRARECAKADVESRQTEYTACKLQSPELQRQLDAGVARFNELPAWVRNATPHPEQRQEWYCSHCRSVVPPVEVTYSEYHESCGTRVGPHPAPAATQGEGEFRAAQSRRTASAETNATADAFIATTIELPPLPEAQTEVAVAGYHDGVLRPALEEYFTADQMRDYALAALSSPPGVQAAQVSDAMVLDAYQLRCAAEFAAPDYEKDEGQRDTALVFQRMPERTVDGEVLPAGMVCWYAEYPEEDYMALEDYEEYTKRLAQSGSAAHGGEVSGE